MPALKLFDLPTEDASGDAQLGRSLSCISCGLYKNALSPKMEPFGEFHRDLMTIGEGPGKDEDRLGKPWQGATGQLLRRTLKHLGIDLDRDCLSTNSVACRPPDNRTPTPHETACCRHRYVMPAILRERPKVILLLGGAATQSIAGSLMSDVNDAITKWRGFRIPVPQWGCWLCPTFHPSFVARSLEEGRREVETIWERDLEAAVEQLKVPVPKPEDLRRKVVILRDEEQVSSALSRVFKGDQFSFDYETTGLHAICHELVSASFATSPDLAFTFTYRRGSKVDEEWRNILADDGVRKIAHNIKFEAGWSLEKFGVEDIAWEWDSMVAAHVIDNRPGICGLKLQSFLQFGIPDYGAVISPFLESVNSKDLTAPNRIYEFVQRYGADELLTYNGLDSLVSMRLALQQIEILRRDHNK